MNNVNSEPDDLGDEDMLPEYDFNCGIRGKHYQDYRAGHSVTIRRDDGSTVVQNFKLQEGAVMLDPEVREYFPDSETVNRALRMLISLIPKERAGTASE